MLQKLEDDFRTQMILLEYTQRRDCYSVEMQVTCEGLKRFYFRIIGLFKYLKVCIMPPLCVHVP